VVSDRETSVIANASSWGHLPIEVEEWIGITVDFRDMKASTQALKDGRRSNQQRCIWRQFIMASTTYLTGWLWKEQKTTRHFAEQEKHTEDS